jgi:hypothetical protein
VQFNSSKFDRRTVVPSARVVDNYLVTDPSLPAVPGAYGAHSNYTAVLGGLHYDTVYSYTVTGPGMPGGGFTASFRTRKLGPNFSFVVVGDEGFFPTVPNSNPARIVDYEARIAHLIYNASNISLPNQPSRPPADFILNSGDNVYNEGTEDNYRDFFFPVYNAIRTRTKPAPRSFAASCSSPSMATTTSVAPASRRTCWPIIPHRSSAET